MTKPYLAISSKPYLQNVQFNSTAPLYLYFQLADQIIFQSRFILNEYVTLKTRTFRNTMYKILQCNTIKTKKSVKKYPFLSLYTRKFINFERLHNHNRERTNTGRTCCFSCKTTMYPSKWNNDKAQKVIASELIEHKYRVNWSSPGQLVGTETKTLKIFVDDLCKYSKHSHACVRVTVSVKGLKREYCSSVWCCSWATGSVARTIVAHAGTACVPRDAWCELRDTWVHLSLFLMHRE